MSIILLQNHFDFGISHYNVDFTDSWFKYRYTYIQTEYTANVQFNKKNDIHIGATRNFTINCKMNNCIFVIELKIVVLHDCARVFKTTNGCVHRNKNCHDILRLTYFIIYNFSVTSHKKAFQEFDNCELEI